MARNMPAPVETPAESAPQWEFASQWSKAWKVIKWSGVALLTIAFLTVIGQGFLFYRIFDDVHPLLGYSFVLLLGALLLLLVGEDHLLKIHPIFERGSINFFMFLELSDLSPYILTFIFELVAKKPNKIPRVPAFPK